MLLLRWGGMSRESIIQATTAKAARVPGVTNQIGTLEAGKLADLIVVDGDPLEDLSTLRNVEVVVKDGEVVVAPVTSAVGSPGDRPCSGEPHLDVARPTTDPQEVAC